MSHRLREEMRVLQMDPPGRAGKEVEADWTFIRQKRPKVHGARGYAYKYTVVSLVEHRSKVWTTHDKQYQCGHIEADPGRVDQVRVRASDR